MRVKLSLVIPAQAGIPLLLSRPPEREGDSSFRWNDGERAIRRIASAPNSNGARHRCRAPLSLRVRFRRSGPFAMGGFEAR